MDKSKVYVDGTAADGCHRSDVAEVLSASVAVDRRVNIACSGAVTKNIFRASGGGEGQNGESPQADQLVKVAKDTNAFAQHAFGVCLTQLYSQAPARFACDDTPGQGNDAMVLRRVGDVPAPPGAKTGSPSSRACLSRRSLTVHLRRRYRGRVVRANVLISGRRVGRFQRVGAAVRVDLRGRPPGKLTVRIVMRLRGGRTVTDVRRYRLCT